MNKRAFIPGADGGVEAANARRLLHEVGRHDEVFTEAV